MSYKYARVGSLNNDGSKVITGADTAFVEPNPGSSVTTTNFNGMVVVFSKQDQIVMNNDDVDTTSANPPFDPNPYGSVNGQPDANAIVNSVTNNANATSVDCTMITGAVNYGYQLSTHYTLAELSTHTALGGHQIMAQQGLTVAQIICNLKGVAVNIMEPLVAHYGKGSLMITSGFRPIQGNAKSQHTFGQAVDIQMPHLNNDAFWAAAQWVAANIPYNQMILEKLPSSQRPWLHLSFGGPKAPYPIMTARTGTAPYTHALVRYF
jgi:hypothetical protein